jgi:hypothetical protein
MKKLFCVIVLVFNSQNIKAEMLNLMPYISLGMSSSVELLDEKESVFGYEVGAEYSWYQKDALHSATRLGLKNISASAGNILVSYEIGMNVLSLCQSITYDVDLFGRVLKPFAAVDLGLGLASAEFNFLGASAESKGKLTPYAALTTGVRYPMGKWIPSIQAGYQLAKVSELEMNGLDEGFTNSANFSSGFVSLGLGMLF